MAVVEFSGDCGEANSTIHKITSLTGMNPGDIAALPGGSTDLSTCIAANDDGRVFSVKIVSSPGMYDYRIEIDCQGPKGAGSGNMYLRFIDKTNDYYDIYIYSSTRSWHTISYNSSNPAIVAICWSDNAFSQLIVV